VSSLGCPGLWQEVADEAFRSQPGYLRQGARLFESTHALGTSLARAFMALSFLAGPVIPELRLTDRGLVDVHRSCFGSLNAEETLAKLPLMLHLALRVA
jgi:adenine deaminase